MKGILLSGGYGKKIWPYAKYHNKGMLKIGNRSILRHLVNALKNKNIEDITIVACHQVCEIQRCFRDDKNLKIIELSQSMGTADTLKNIIDDSNEDYIVIYGDCLIMEEDLQRFMDSEAQILISHLHQSATLQICVEIDDNRYLKQFWGHPRGEFEYFASAFKLNKAIKSYLDTSAYFNVTKVGVGSPEERYLESAINDYIKDGHDMSCYLSTYQIYDIDKPWHIMEANRYYNQYIFNKMNQKVIGDNTYISQSVKISNHVWIGKDCYIGDYVVLEDGCVIEDHTRIDQGAIIGKGVHIGKNCIIENYCKIGDFTSIGDECIIGHTSEIIEAVLFDKVYLYHYGEYYGVIGTHTDIGAGTTCGTLRFDDGKTRHYVCGHKEIPESYSNACYIGDYSRTGVGAILLPGCKIGSKSIVGSGVILNEDVEDGTLIYPKQELCKKKWGDDQYGW